MLDQEDAKSPEETDEYIGTENLFPREEIYQREMIIRYNRYVDGNIVSIGNTNPVLVTRVYEAKLLGGNGIEISSNR